MIDKLSPGDAQTAFPPLRLGQQAPDFTARSTQGVVRLSDFRGRWLVLFSHPADFTPVCTSEFVAIARAAEAFDALGCVLMALSVDSLFSHLAWIRAIRDKFGVPARRGGMVTINGFPGVITGMSGDFVRVKLAGKAAGIPFHPHEIEYSSADGRAGCH